MINPIAIAACLALGFGGLAFAFVGGDSRADKRRAAVAKTDAKASVAAGVDRAARKKQIADGVRDSEMKGKRRRVSLATKIEQAGLSITKQQYWIGSVAPWPDLRRLDLSSVEKFDPHASCRRDRHDRVAATHAGAPAHSAHQQVHLQLSDRHRHHRARHQIRPSPWRYDPDRRDRKPRAGEVGVSKNCRGALDWNDLVGRHRADGATRSDRRNQFLLDRHRHPEQGGRQPLRGLGQSFACVARTQKDEGERSPPCRWKRKLRQRLSARCRFSSSARFTFHLPNTFHCCGRRVMEK